MQKLNEMIKNQHGRIGGYLLGWVFGVPVTLLVLIYILRGH